MPSVAYTEAFELLEEPIRIAINGAFAAWGADTEHAQVGRNVMAETAIEVAVFCSLLRAFGSQLAPSAVPKACWLDACRAHKLRGRQIPPDRCPSVLGRARGLNDHAVSIARASRGGLTVGEARKLLLKYADSLDTKELRPFLQETPLGRFFVWATFDPNALHANPFDHLPSDADGIRIALGLGHVANDEALILLVWSHADSGAPPLHRPTVADAEDYSYYRPCLDPSALWGQTEPLQPNPRNLESQPEVVMRETTGQGLRLPFTVVWL